MTIVVRRYTDAAAFLERARDWLVAAEAENNLVLGLAHQLVSGNTLFQGPCYHAVIEEDGVVAGCALRTPPYKLCVTRMPIDAVRPLMDDVALVYDTIPAVLGDAITAEAAARAWAHRHGCTVEPGIRHRIYQLERVIPPPQRPIGRSRQATLRDTDLVTQWIVEFSAESGVHTDSPDRLALSRIRLGSMFLWEVEGAAVSMAAWSGETPHGRRVGYVYTPAAHRGRGYASALVADVSSRILTDGCSHCFLFTDLANPTSNSIYQRIGYEPVADVIDWNINCT